MSDWEPLSVRLGDAEPFPLMDGVPAHLASTAWEWIEDSLTRTMDVSDSTAQAICLRLHIAGDPRFTRTDWIRNACASDQGTFLDVIDMVLALTGPFRGERLRPVLEAAGSLWTVSPNGRSLTKRVTDAEEQAYNAAVEPADQAADELHQAWAKAYGVRADSSDAWDHAIKAVEIMLLPLVVPAMRKGTLSNVIGELGKQAKHFQFRLASSSDRTTNIEALVQLLRLMWPNPDRHGGAESRVPTSEEAQNVVNLAVLIVNWTRSGALRRIDD